MKWTLHFIFLFLLQSAISQQWTAPLDQPIELGQVHWFRDYDHALTLSKEQELPVFIFFQEVPGCHTCSSFGYEVMSHPLIVETIETHFIPLVIYNNKGGEDAKILKLYKEPSWNNPVIRIVDHLGKDIVKRHARAYQPWQVVQTMMTALTTSGQLIPEYLSLLSTELKEGSDEAILSMYCYWTGEKAIGSINGVASTTAGYMNGTEVVKVKYDADKINYADLIQQAAQSKCADRVYTDDQEEKKTAWSHHIPSKGTASFRISKDDKYYLSKSKYKGVPLLDIQATKANAMIANRQNPESLFSPRQIIIYKMLQKGGLAKDRTAYQSFVEHWDAVIEGIKL